MDQDPITKKRKSDYTLQELWREWDDLIKMLAFVFVLGGAFWQFTAYAKTVDKHEMEIPALQTGVALANQKLDLIMDFYRIPHKELLPKGN